MLKHASASRAGMYIWSELPSGQSKGGNTINFKIHAVPKVKTNQVFRRSLAFLGLKNSGLFSYRPL